MWARRAALFGSQVGSQLENRFRQMFEDWPTRRPRLSMTLTLTAQLVFLNLLGEVLNHYTTPPVSPPPRSQPPRI
jgi:hypothetical protein